MRKVKLPRARFTCPVCCGTGTRRVYEYDQRRFIDADCRQCRGLGLVSLSSYKRMTCKDPF